MPCGKRYYIGKDMHFLLVGLMALFSGITVLTSETLWNRVLADVKRVKSIESSLVQVSHIYLDLLHIVCDNCQRTKACTMIFQTHISSYNFHHLKIITAFCF